MTNEKTIKQVQERLLKMRHDGDFEGQLVTYKELGHLYSLQGEYDKAANYLRKASRIASFLNKENECEAIYYSLISVYESNNDLDSVIDVYSLLHIHFNLLGDSARGSEYNNIRLKLVAKRIGKKNPSDLDRFAYEFERSSKSHKLTIEQYASLLRGDNEPTIPGEYVEACVFLVELCLADGRYKEAQKYVTECEHRTQNIGVWSDENDIDNIQKIKQTIEQHKDEAS